MLEGYPALDEYWQQNPLPITKSALVFLQATFLQLIKLLSFPIRIFRKSNILAGLDEAKNFGLKPLGTSRRDKGPHYLSEDEVKAFEERGIYGPFELLSKEEALDLRLFTEKMKKSKFEGNYILSDKIISALERSNALSLNIMGLWQALNHPVLWDTLSMPKLTHKLSSLLGDNLICWRSQFFELEPKSNGTFWHQTGTFREVADRPKLVPSVSTDEGMEQLSVWIALKDVKKENGCLRFLEGSHTDGRFERFAYNVIENKFDFLMSLSFADMIKVIKTLNYTSGYFLKSQMMFEFATSFIPDLFQEFEVCEMEMKAGEAIIFTSLNTHASFPNISSDNRLAFAGRFTRSDVAVYKGFETDIFPTPEGNIEWDISKVKCIPVLGKSDSSFNNIALRPEDESVKV